MPAAAQGKELTREFLEKDCSQPQVQGQQHLPGPVLPTSPLPAPPPGLGWAPRTRTPGKSQEGNWGKEDRRARGGGLREGAWARLLWECAHGPKPPASQGHGLWGTCTLAQTPPARSSHGPVGGGFAVWHAALSSCPMVFSALFQTIAQPLPGLLPPFRTFPLTLHTAGRR